jgi:hypothetical protein
MRRIRAFFAALLLVSLVAVGFGHVTAEPAGAYYGETADYKAIYFSHSNRGCLVDFYVENNRSVKFYCELKNSSSGWAVYKSYYVNYSCYQWGGCMFYNQLITGWDGWHPVGVKLEKTTGWSGQHGHFTSWRTY